MTDEIDKKVEDNYRRFIRDLNGAEEFPGDRKIIMLLTKNLIRLRELKERKSVTGEITPDYRERYRNYMNN